MTTERSPAKTRGQKEREKSKRDASSSHDQQLQQQEMSPPLRDSFDLNTPESILNSGVDTSIRPASMTTETVAVTRQSHQLHQQTNQNTRHNRQTRGEKSPSSDNDSEKLKLLKKQASRMAIRKAQEEVDKLFPEVEDSHEEEEENNANRGRKTSQDGKLPVDRWYKSIYGQAWNATKKFSGDKGEDANRWVLQMLQCFRTIGGSFRHRSEVQAELMGTRLDGKAKEWWQSFTLEHDYLVEIEDAVEEFLAIFGRPQVLSELLRNIIACKQFTDESVRDFVVRQKQVVATYHAACKLKKKVQPMSENDLAETFIDGLTPKIGLLVKAWYERECKHDEQPSLAECREEALSHCRMQEEADKHPQKASGRSHNSASSSSSQPRPSSYGNQRTNNYSHPNGRNKVEISVNEVEVDEETGVDVEEVRAQVTNHKNSRNQTESQPSHAEKNKEYHSERIQKLESRVEKYHENTNDELARIRTRLDTLPEMIRTELKKVLEDQAQGRGGYFQRPLPTVPETSRNDGSQANCYFCQEPGHLKRNCLKYQNWVANRTNTASDNSNQTKRENFH